MQQEEENPKNKKEERVDASKWTAAKLAHASKLVVGGATAGRKVET